MQPLLAELFWNSEEIAKEADLICQTVPGYYEAKQQYDSIAEKVQAIVGYDIYDELFARFLDYTNYELFAYYALGLGLRKEVAQALRL